MQIRRFLRSPGTQSACPSSWLAITCTYSRLLNLTSISEDLPFPTQHSNSVDTQCAVAATRVGHERRTLASADTHTGIAVWFIISPLRGGLWSSAPLSVLIPVISSFGAGAFAFFLVLSGIGFLFARLRFGHVAVG